MRGLLLLLLNVCLLAPFPTVPAERDTRPHPLSRLESKDVENTGYTIRDGWLWFHGIRVTPLDIHEH